MEIQFNMTNKIYKVYRYYGGEKPNDITWAMTLGEAQMLGSQAEHYEIEEVKLKRHTL